MLGNNMDPLLSFCKSIPDNLNSGNIYVKNNCTFSRYICKSFFNCYVKLNRVTINLEVNHTKRVSLKTRDLVFKPVESGSI